MSHRAGSAMVLVPVAFLLAYLVGSLKAQPLQKAHFSSCQNGDFEIQCSNLNDSIWVYSAIHSVADLWHCRNCASGCMGDQTYGRSSFHSDYGWTVGTLCNGRNQCQLDKWCSSDCVETFNVTFSCVGNKEKTDMTGQLPTPASDLPDAENKQDVVALGSVAGVELQRAHLSTCTNQTFDIGCSDNSSIIILSVAHSVADPWTCPNCTSTCMGGQFYSQHSYYSHHTYRSHHSHHSHHHTHHSYHNTYHHTYHSRDLMGRVSGLCNACPQCTIDKWCGSHCVETYNITYYCVNSTNIGTTCWKPGSPDYVVLRQCPVRINPALRSGGSPTTQVTVTVLTPYRNHLTVCRWSDRTCRQVTSRNTTLTGGFSLLPAGQAPVILQLDYHITSASTSDPGKMPASGTRTTVSAVGGVQKNAGDRTPVKPVSIKISETTKNTLPPTLLGQTKSVQTTTTTLSPEPSASLQPALFPDFAGPILTVTSINGIDTGQQNPQEGVRGTLPEGGLGIVDIVGIAAAMVGLLLLVIIVASLVTYYKRSCVPATTSNLKRRPVFDNVYITDSEYSSSTGTTDTDWITLEEAYNQRHVNPGSMRLPPLPPRRI